MKYLDLSFADPANNLACDEALLTLFEKGRMQEPLLRLWQAAAPFVVLGHANKLRLEARLPACAAAGIPVLRRMSGGGAVVQGPGCLNYSLIVNAQTEGIASVGGTFNYVLGRHRRLVERLKGVEVSLDGVSDLTTGGRKFSGNAQYRKRTWVLVHGTFLLDFELPLIERCLSMPEREPAYRRHRAHADFVVNLKLPSREMRRGLVEAWAADREFTEVPWEAIEGLAHTRYRRTDWLEKF
jgi:lipoate---protein ligase